MTQDEFKKLDIGDMIRHVDLAHRSLIVVGNFGDHIVASDTWSLSNPDEWVLISKVASRSGGRDDE